MKKDSNEKIKLIYGTGNPAKLAGMVRTLSKLPIEIIGLKEAGEIYHKQLPEIEEDGSDPLENARLKAKAYAEVFRMPVFSCDSGLYLWNHETGELLPEDLQPGIHVRGRGGKRYTDDELIEKYTSLAKRHGPVLARYKNAVCLVDEKGNCHESMDESLWGDAFLLAEKPHERRVDGFPLDSISLEIESGKYYYDLQDNAQDEIAADLGFAAFFEKYIKNTYFVR